MSLSWLLPGLRQVRPAAVGRFPLVAVPQRSLSLFNRLSKESTVSLNNDNLEVIFQQENFADRHIGPDPSEIELMLNAVNQKSLQSLGDAIVEPAIRLSEDLTIRKASEEDALKELKAMATKNQINFKTYLGMGYYGTVTPKPILRHLLEDAGWYTPYTPYQSEISQGRLESLLNFQTMVAEITAMDVANASLLDEATAAAEAMSLAFNRLKGKRNKFFVSEDVHPQTIDVLQTRAEPRGLEVVIGNHKDFAFTNEYFGALFQYPATKGRVDNFNLVISALKGLDIVPICATDLLALTLLNPPGDMGFEIAIGNSQRFGVPLGYGGPHAAFFATKEKYRRVLPGRVIGVSKDKEGNRAYRMALQTREQHIRREKATSNICTAQALLANVAAMYGVYHGPKGLALIAERVHQKTLLLASALRHLGVVVAEDYFFDTICVMIPNSFTLVQYLDALEINVRRIGDDCITISFDETVSKEDISTLINAFATFLNVPSPAFEDLNVNFNALMEFRRTSKFMEHPVFNTYHSETEIMRYISSLSRKDLGLNTSMVPLGSCTMKLNSVSELLPISWPEFNSLHPFVPPSQAGGYTQMFREIEETLIEITGFHSISLQPNAGSQGEFSGLLAIRKYLASQGQGHRDVCVIPESAHGTNPASAKMVGMKIVTVSCKGGNIDADHLKEVVEKHSDNLAALMMTFPATYGFFDNDAKGICELIHAHGGQVYMDGANMNAQVGLTSPGEVGADVCHLNLHKTFCIPHGGGGPGMGPIAVAEHLAPFLPSHSVSRAEELASGTGAVSAASHGSASILPIVWMYLRMMGAEGLKKATQVALLSANYMASELEGHYKLLFRGSSGYVAHEFILDIRPFKSIGVNAEDIAKRLMDYGFHSPTLSFPVAGTLMIEPTESESWTELRRYIEALLDIRRDIAEIESGEITHADSVLAHAPHTQAVCTADSWDRKYTREKAAFPLPFVRNSKFWPAVARIDNVYGDRNLFCSCPPIEDDL